MGRRRLAADCWPRTSSRLLPAAYERPPTTGRRRVTADAWPHIPLATFFWQRAALGRLPLATGRRLLAAYHWPPTTGRLLLADCFWPPPTVRFRLDACDSPSSTAGTCFWRRLPMAAPNPGGTYDLPPATDGRLGRRHVSRRRALVLLAHNTRRVWTAAHCMHDR